MAAACRLQMVRHPTEHHEIWKEADPSCCRNGFTLLEMLLVLFIVSSGVTLGASIHQPEGLQPVMKQLMMILETEQETAIMTRTRRSVRIEEHAISTSEERLSFPDGIACSPFEISFTPRGTVSKAGTIYCSSTSHQAKLVIQLGMGRMRYEVIQ